MKEQEETEENVHQLCKKRKPSKSQYQFQELSKREIFLPPNLDVIMIEATFQLESTIKALT
jgi:hypothetical protein